MGVDCPPPLGLFRAPFVVSSDTSSSCKVDNDFCRVEDVDNDCSKKVKKFDSSVVDGSKKCDDIARDASLAMSVVDSDGARKGKKCDKGFLLPYAVK